MEATLQSQIDIDCQGIRVSLRGDGTAYIPSSAALLVADLHLGKGASFRAGGLPVPTGMDSDTITMLGASVRATNCKSMFFLGDLIHDRHSLTPDLIQQFTAWKNDLGQVHVTLVRGNHDRHVKNFPADWNMDVVHEMQIEGLELRHEVSDSSLAENKNFQIGGHWHPVVSVGRGADKMRISCFVVSDRHITLPAFGPFKGGLKPNRTARTSFFPICDGKIWKMKKRCGVGNCVEDEKAH